MTGRRRLRAHSDNDFRDAVHITPEPAEEGSPFWATAEEPDDEEDGTPPHADAGEPELIDMPLAPASALQLGAVHRTAPGVRRWTALTLPKKLPPASHLSVSLSVVSRVGCLVCLSLACVSTFSMS